MAETEKITINVGPVDLGQIDLVVEQGFYTNRIDFIRITNECNGVKCTLIGYVEGEQKPFVPTEEDAGLIGQMIGKLHNQASS